MSARRRVKVGHFKHHSAVCGGSGLYSLFSVVCPTLKTCNHPELHAFSQHKLAQGRPRPLTESRGYQSVAVAPATLHLLVTCIASKVCSLGRRDVFSRALRVGTSVSLIGQTVGKGEILVKPIFLRNSSFFLTDFKTV